MRFKPAEISDVSIQDIAVSYATQQKTRCTFTHRDGYVQVLCGLKIHGMRRVKSGEHLLDVEYHGDLNRPGEDAGDDCRWHRAKIRYNEFQKIGRVYYTRHRIGKR